MTAFDYVKTYYTNKYSNGRLGCFGQEYGDPYVLLFAVGRTDKIKRSMTYSVRVSEDGIKFERIGHKKKYSEEDVLGIMESVAAVSADYQKWRISNEET